MRRIKLLIFSLLLIFASCSKTPDKTIARNNGNSTRLEQVADKYSYDDLKQILYLKESKQGGLLAVSARIFRSPFTKTAIVELSFRNYARITSFYDVQVELKFITNGGKIFSKKRQTIKQVIEPCEENYVYRIKFNNEMKNISSVSVEIVDYKTKLADR